MKRVQILGLTLSSLIVTMTTVYAQGEPKIRFGGAFVQGSLSTSAGSPPPARLRVAMTAVFFGLSKDPPSIGSREFVSALRHIRNAAVET